MENYKSGLKERVIIAMTIFALVAAYTKVREYHQERRVWAKAVVADWSACDELEVDKGFNQRWLDEQLNRFSVDMESHLRTLEDMNGLEDYVRQKRDRNRKELDDNEAAEIHFEREREVNAQAWECRAEHGRKYGAKAFSNAKNFLQ